MTSRGGWEEELRDRLHDVFMAEASERLDGVEAAVRAVAAGAPEGDIDRHFSDAFRHAHTLKGGARAVGLPDVERLARTLEALFERLRSGGPAGPDTWTAVTAGVGTLRAYLAGEPADVDAAVSGLTAVLARGG